MAYSELTAHRLRDAIGARAGVTEKKMFGGIAFLLDGKMFVGVVGEDAMVRVGKDAHEDALAQPGVRPMDFTGRPMAGYIYVAAAQLADPAVAARWVDRAVSFVQTIKK